ncbi:MAG: cellulase family glycosylhydrolase [Acidobacteriota bacterium]|nr:cellulase family glycosylhydrolase [Acidobacteriota bacterium]
MRKLKTKWAFLFALVITITGGLHAQRWSAERANAWYQHQPWMVGSNFIPATAINELEMWQGATFDPAEIDKELGWAEGMGMNTMRVFLHDLLWQQDAPGFKQRMDAFLTIASRHHIRPMFVLFDSCWDPFPKLGPQHPPIPGVHNSGWVQSPGAAALADASQQVRLKEYVQGVVGAFAADNRILAWDVWNEPNNENERAYGTVELKNKKDFVRLLLPKAFEWARSANPSQPLTSGVWEGDWSAPDKLTPMQRIQMDESDVISFHNYSWPENFEQHIKWLQRYGRPILCTEFMARGAGSTFDTVLPIAKKYHVAAMNWGLVLGKTQTNLPWDSWSRPYTQEGPPNWFHEVFHADGKPYREREVEIIKELTRRSQ